MKLVPHLTRKVSMTHSLSLTSIVSVSLAALLLVSCGDATSDDDTTMDAAASVETPDGLPASLNADDKVLVMVDRLIPEDSACLVMMSIVNGTDETVTAGLFAFDVTGNGETMGANMFPQTAEPDTVETAQIVLPGADCVNVKVIEGGQLNCKITDTDETCVDVSELRDGIVEFSSND